MQFHFHESKDRIRKRIAQPNQRRICAWDLREKRIGAEKVNFVLTVQIILATIRLISAAIGFQAEICEQFPARRDSHADDPS
jgi:hypothetical protein